MFQLATYLRQEAVEENHLMSINMVAGSVALILIFSVMAAKFITTRMLARMRRQIGQVGQLKQDALNRLKAAQSHKTVMVKNVSVTERKKGKLSKTITQRRKDLAGIKDDEETRRKRVRSRKVE